MYIGSAVTQWVLFVPGEQISFMCVRCNREIFTRRFCVRKAPPWTPLFFVMQQSNPVAAPRSLVYMFYAERESATDKKDPEGPKIPADTLFSWQTAVIQ